jgi:hypothetical protein
MSDRKVVSVKFNHAAVADEGIKNFDKVLLDAIKQAELDGVAPGIVVAILQARLFMETAIMIEDSQG